MTAVGCAVLVEATEHGQGARSEVPFAVTSDSCNMISLAVKPLIVFNQ